MKKAKSSLRKITFYSFGHKLSFKDCYPAAPKNMDIRQFVFDVRDMVGEIFPSDEKDVPLSGLNRSMRKSVIKNLDKNGFYAPLVVLMLSLIINFIEQKGDETARELRIYFGCKGGWQRSVAIAEKFTELSECLVQEHNYKKKSKIKLNISHLTIGKWPTNPN